MDSGLYRLKLWIIMMAVSIAFAAATTSVASATNNTTTEPSISTTTFLQYKNPEWGISMQYPSNWTASTSGLLDYTELIAFYSPLQNFSQASSVRFSISAVKYIQNVSLPEYTRFALDGLNQSEFEIKSSSEVTLSGYPAYRVVFADKPSQNVTSQPLYNVYIWSAVGNRLYILTYSADESAFYQHLPELSQMLDSFRIGSINNK